MSLLGNFFADITNWIRGWSNVTFAIVMAIFVILATIFFINLIKGFTGSKVKFRFFSFLFLAIIIGLTVYVCLAR